MLTKRAAQIAYERAHGALGEAATERVRHGERAGAARDEAQSAGRREARDSGEDSSRDDDQRRSDGIPLCRATQSLLEVLRDELAFDGHEGRLHDGRLRRVLGRRRWDGELVPACLVLAARGRGSREVQHDRGHRRRPNGSHPVQQQFLEHGALQCGICTPGFIVAAEKLLEKNPNPTEEEARYYLAGNLCRCTGYDKIMCGRCSTRPPTAGGAGMSASIRRPHFRIVSKFKQVGSRPVRHDGLEKVTGRARFGADVSLPGACSTARSSSAARTPTRRSWLDRHERRPRRCPACGDRHRRRLSGRAADARMRRSGGDRSRRRYGRPARRHGPGEGALTTATPMAAVAATIV